MFHFGWKIWIKNCKFSEKFNTNKVILMGDSAGGNIITMTTLLVINFPLRNFLFGSNFPEDDSFPKITCIAYLYGANERINIVEHWPNGSTLLKEYIGLENSPYDYEKIIPNNAATPFDLCSRGNFSLSPVLLVTGTKDPLRGGTFLLEELFKKNNVDVTVSTYEGETHGFFSFLLERKCKEVISGTDFLFSEV